MTTVTMREARFQSLGGAEFYFTQQSVFGIFLVCQEVWEVQHESDIVSDI